MAFARRRACVRGRRTCTVSCTSSCSEAGEQPTRPIRCRMRLCLPAVASCRRCWWLCCSPSARCPGRVDCRPRGGPQWGPLEPRMQTLLVTRLEPDRRTTMVQCTVEPAILAWPSGRMSPSSRSEKCLSSFATCQRRPNPVSTKCQSGGSILSMRCRSAETVRRFEVRVFTVCIYLRD